MKNSIFDYFAYLASTNVSYTIKSGRYNLQKSQEKNIPEDIINKLEISKKDSFLEIGCGLGNLTIPLLEKLEKLTVIDHPIIIQKFKERKNSKKIDYIKGNFIKKKISKKFDKILVYGVVHCLKDEKELNKFITKVVKLLKNNGIALIADIPNLDKKKKVYKI